MKSDVCTFFLYVACYQEGDTKRPIMMWPRCLTSALTNGKHKFLYSATRYPARLPAELISKNSEITVLRKQWPLETHTSTRH